jgi:ferritin-like protein
MAQSAGFHEAIESLKPQTMDRHRAIVSIMEELDAVDWYDQRVDASQDEELRAILAHNRDEEKEHAAMVLEWLRRRDPELDRMLRQYLFIDMPILEREEQQTEAEAAAHDSGPARAIGDGSLGIGSLREKVQR